MTPEGTHLATTSQAKNAKVRTHVHVCAHERQKNEDMARGRDGTKVYVVVMKGTKCTGTNNETHLIVKT